MGLSVLSWSVDPRDWASDDAAAITAAVTSNIRNGDIILLHDMSESSVEAAFSIIDGLRKQGYTFVTAKELARLKGHSIEPGKLYRSFS
jgi:peptidoglycan/xylan/chitin deacetylase (PgdA/CDA1 family)